jgi:hypothetical protein
MTKLRAPFALYVNAPKKAVFARLLAFNVVVKMVIYN